MTAIRKERQGQEMALTAGIVALIVIFSLLPMARLLQEVILPGGQFSLDIIRNGLIDETTWRATWNTLA